MSTLTSNAIKVLERRYLAKDDQGEIIETPSEMFRRIAHAIAQADRNYYNVVPQDFDERAALQKTEDIFFDMLWNLEFLPNSPTLMNAGRKLGQLAACFVLPVNNTVEEILTTMKNTALIHKSGGGTGFNFSWIDLPAYFTNFKPMFLISSKHPDAAILRNKKLKHAEVMVYEEGFSVKGKGFMIEDNMEDIFSLNKLLQKPTYIDFTLLRKKGSRVHTTNGEASGPASFMDVWDEAVGFLNAPMNPITTIKLFNICTEAVKQGGTRRGANMGIVNIDNPYIMDFITCKSDNAEITNFNISVGLSEEFMKAYMNGENYDIHNYLTGEKVGERSSVEVFDTIVDGAYRNGEPGIIFLDRINSKNPVLGLVISSTNPCGEQPLLPYEACNLGSINLMAHIKRNQDGKVTVDENKLTYTVHKAVHFLDNVIDVNKYPIQEIADLTRKYRKIGLGVMGWADLLYVMKIPYNSQEALDLADKIGDLIATEAGVASIRLGHERGSFDGIDETIFKGSVRRNATCTTIAPTGTLSMIASVSSGIEPNFAISYIKNVMDNDELSYVNPIFEGAFQETLKPGEMLASYHHVFKAIAKVGTVAHMDDIPDEIKRVFVTAHDITPDWHILHQATWQKYTDNAVSKTINMSHEATREDVKAAYLMAYNTYCKGVTIYRDGSRDNQVLNIGSVNKTPASAPNADAAQKAEQVVKPMIEGSPIKMAPLQQNLPRPRPDVVPGFTKRIQIGCGKLYVTVNFDEDGICEVFTNTGRAGGCPSQSEATARLASLALRSNIPVKSIMEQLKGIRCPSTIGKKTGALSCPDAVGRVIEQMYDYLTSGTPIPGMPAGLTFGYLQDENAATEDEMIMVESNIKCTPDQCTGCTMKDFCNNPDKATDTTEACRISVSAEEQEQLDKGKCPECGKPIEHEGGCNICRHCGFSKCG